jgi:isopentenyl phosphate kinase
MEELVFLKLGGSLITKKTQRYVSRPDVLRTLAGEIHSALNELAQLRLVLGHGSGSFGHFAVIEHLNPSKYPPTRQARPRSDSEYWKGVAEVWYRASQLNRHVVDALHEAGVPAISLAPSACVASEDGNITGWETGPLRAALESGVLPVIFGDIVFDPVAGGKVLSTEVLMWHLAQQLRPTRILLAGLEEAVWADLATRSSPISRITPSTFGAVAEKIGASHGPDVTGGMRSKVEEMLALVQAIPGLQVQIFSGVVPGNVRRALAGEALGTTIAGD